MLWELIDSVDKLNPKATRFIVRAGWLLDGAGSPIQNNVFLQIQGGRIVGVTSKASDGQPYWNLLNCTLLPCLTDAHVHLSMSGTLNPETRQQQLKAGYDEAVPVIERHIRILLAFGVIAVRDGGDHYGHVLRYVQDFRASPLVVRTAGRAWHQVGRYGRLIGRPPAEGCSLAEAIASETAAIDHVKLVNSGLNSLTVFGKETQPQFDLEDIKAAVKAAAKKGWLVMVHANGQKPVRIAVQAGCRSIEHGFFMGRDNLKRMADQGTVWVPTAGTMTAYAASLPEGSIEAKVARQNADAQLEQLALARDLGVTVALGTDAGSMGVFHGAGIVEEMRLLKTAGYSISEIVSCAASKGAALLGMAKAPILEKSRDATFIVVPGPPSDLPESLNSIRHIVVKGRCLSDIEQTTP